MATVFGFVSKGCVGGAQAEEALKRFQKATEMGELLRPWDRKGSKLANRANGQRINGTPVLTYCVDSVVIMSRNCESTSLLFLSSFPVVTTRLPTNRQFFKYQRLVGLLAVWNPSNLLDALQPQSDDISLGSQYEKMCSTACH